MVPGAVVRAFVDRGGGGAERRHEATARFSHSSTSPYCLTLDPRADQYPKGIFGQLNYLFLDQVERLPEHLPQLYTGLTR